MAASISGVVKDSTGDVVSGAAVIVRGGSGPERRATTGPDGRFTIDSPETGDVTVIVRAGGFAEKTEKVPAAHTGDVNAVLAPAGLFETVTVTPTRSEQRLGDTPASVDVVTSKEIAASPALVADDVLRNVPTFSLFRRTSSLVAQPTTQGVSLRGIGPSGQSRTLVLLDGIPFNDPFGGWVYWTRVPLESVDRIEMTDGTNSSLYGNYAMGGVINIITTRPTRQMGDLKTRVFGDISRAHFNFLAVTNAATTRNIVRLATDQNVPTNGAGASGSWTKTIGGRNVVSAGADWRRVDGDSEEAAYVASAP